MKIKLSDFILENSINNSDIVDIEMEQLRAQMNVYCELANYYIKQMRLDVITEAAPAQQPPSMPTKDQLQQPSSSYTQDIDTDMPAGYNVTFQVEKAFKNSGIMMSDYSTNDRIMGYLQIPGNEKVKWTYQLQYHPSESNITVHLIANEVTGVTVSEYRRLNEKLKEDPYHVDSADQKRGKKPVTYNIDGNGDINTQVANIVNELKNHIRDSYPEYSSSPQQQETPQETTQQQETPQETPQQQQNPMSAKTVAALASAIIALAVFISKFLGYLNRITNSGLNLIRIKESIDASKKYIDMMYGMALNNNFNDNDFNEFARQFQELINLVERSIANSGNKPTDQRYVQNAQSLINSPEVKDMMSKIQQIQNARFKQQLDSSLQNINPQNLQRFNSDFQRLKNGMTQMLESSMQEAKSASYQQFTPAQQNQTTYQPQQAKPQPQQKQQPQSGGKLAQMQ